MTIEEFSKTSFGAGMTATIKGVKHNIISIDFDQFLIGIDEFKDGETISWYRCENAEVHAKDLSIVELIDHFKTNNFQP